MAPPTPALRVLVLIDGQNLYHSARNAWAPDPAVKSSAYGWPSFDVEKVAALLVNRKPNRTLSQTRFYTGVPDPHRGNVQEFWHGFWNNKLRHLSSRGVYTYRGRVNPGGQEKGVDVSLAIDLIKLTYEKLFEVAVIVSQDWDFGPAVHMAKELARSQGRVLGFESAYPENPSMPRGVPGTEWYKIKKAEYDTCLDSRDYRIRPVP